MDRGAWQVWKKDRRWTETVEKLEPLDSWCWKRILPKARCSKCREPGFPCSHGSPLRQWGGMCAPRPPFICHSSAGYRERRPFPEYSAWQMADGTRRDPEGERRQALHRWEASCSQERGDPRCLLAVPDTPVYGFSSASIFSWPCCFTEDRDSWEVAPSCVCSSHSGLAGVAAFVQV